MEGGPGTGLGERVSGGGVAAADGMTARSETWRNIGKVGGAVVRYLLYCNYGCCNSYFIQHWEVAHNASPI